ncbi:ABC transporter substrate-binding protein [Pleurocapsa sp. CCALA 161]|uniref:ABC transporter substrate-binding protein n=1 Tax=Pleurocapsa sp. CCALA 161 TaxID=2107688 RepID=UPI000D0706C3|nr:sugar ABC transporter substrate-binding protein [Pleurocapsa sp. CCALA 161]PSB09454.1 ABC transporter substrate-binding protein [Pleurocapsa sp. CCALA 161]
MKINISIKRLSLFLLLGMILGASGCNPQKRANSNQLEFWTMQLKPNFTKYFTDINQTFEEQNKTVKLRWIDVSWSAMENKILTSISAKTAPDVVNLNPKFASQLATRNAWLDLEPRVTPKVKATYLPKIWQASTIEVCQDRENTCNQQTFGLPWYLTTTITIYNQKLLTAANLTQVPQTYSELAQAAKEIKAKTGKYAFFISFVPNDSGDVLESLVKMGVNLIDESGKAAFNTPEGKAAFQYWVDLYQQQLLPPDVLTQGHRRGVELYQAGEIALLSSGAEFIDSINNNAPTVAQVSAVAPQITGENEKKSVAVMNLVIPRDSDKSAEALKYALFVTNTKNQLAFAQESNVLPSTTEAVEQYIKNIEQQPNSLKEQAKKVSASQLENAEILIPVTKNIHILQKTIYENLQAAMLKEKSVDQAVQDAAKEWNSLKDK